MTFRTILPAALLAFGCGTALAESNSNGTGLFLEPGVTYQMNEANTTFSGGLTSSNAVTKGFGVVLKAGIHVYDRFFVAADGRYSMLKFSDNANHYNESASSWDLSPVVGMQMPDIGARLFAGYVVTGSMDPKGSNGIDPMLEDANGFRVGAGLKLHEFSVNFEWQTIRYGKSTIAATNGGAATEMSYKSDGIVASVTFPVEFN